MKLASHPNPVREMNGRVHAQMPSGFARKTKGRCIAPKGRSGRAKVFVGTDLVLWLIDNGMLEEAQKALDKLK